MMPSSTHAWGAASAKDDAFFIRPLTPADRGRYVRAFAGLSSETRYMRFGTPMHFLSEAEIDRFISPDGHQHVAVAALSRQTTDILAVARYFRVDDSAEIALTVADGWRYLGIGSVLLNVLIEHAQCDGVRMLTAETIAANRGAHALLHHASFERVLTEGREMVFQRPLNGDISSRPRTSPT